VEGLAKSSSLRKSRVFETNSEPARPFESLLGEPLDLWRYCAGVADFYREAARLVVAHLGDPTRVERGDSRLDT
jgi:hypothetical protein